MNSSKENHEIAEVDGASMTYQEAGWEQFRRQEDGRSDVAMIKSRISDLLSREKISEHTKHPVPTFS